MAEPFLGEIMVVGFNFPPKGWAFCDGQILSIQQNAALFSLLGTTYGGDGVRTFGLPDLRGRAMVGWGQGPGLSNYQLGESGGQETHTLITTEMPAHSHTITSSSHASDSADPGPPAVLPDAFGYAYAPTPNSSNPDAPSTVGGSQPHQNMMPYLAVYHCIALVGIFPSRN